MLEFCFPESKTYFSQFDFEKTPRRRKVLASQKFTGGEGRRQWNKRWGASWQNEPPPYLDTRRNRGGTSTCRRSHATARFAGMCGTPTHTRRCFVMLLCSRCFHALIRSELNKSRAVSNQRREKKGAFNYLSTRGDCTVKGRRLHLGI